MLMEDVEDTVVNEEAPIDDMLDDMDVEIATCLTGFAVERIEKERITYNSSTIG